MAFEIKGTFDRSLGDWLNDKPFCLVMSAGFFGFYAHTGMLCALEDRGITPRSVAGASAGSLIAGLWASGRSAWSIADSLLAIDRQAFWDPGVGLGVLRGEKFATILANELRTNKFSECRVPCAISVYNVNRRRTEVFSEGNLKKAIRASCALPGLFQPVKIAGHYYSDGGILDRPGMAGVTDEQRTFYHHLGTRSPWRRRTSHSMIIPSRDELATLVIAGLPRLNPFRLEEGKEALNVAYKATLDALDSRRLRSSLPRWQKDAKNIDNDNRTFSALEKT